jgi:hypothetical protein
MQAAISPTGRSNGPVIALVVWGVLALIVSASGVLVRLPFPAPMLVGALTVLLAFSFAVFPSLREFARKVDLRAVLVLHLVRFVGFYFLYLYGQGRLPYAFAVPGGWGDNVVALGVVVLLALGLGRPGKNSRGLLLAAQVWNVFGLVDILGVVGTGVRYFLQNPSALVELTHLPLALLPTYIVPLIIVSHFVIATRLRNDGTA